MQVQAAPAGPQSRDEHWETALRDWARRRLGEGHTGLHAQAHERFERALFDAALETHGGHRQKAASALGLGRNTLTRKLGSSRKGPREPG